MAKKKQDFVSPVSELKKEFSAFHSLLEEKWLGEFVEDPRDPEDVREKYIKVITKIYLQHRPSNCEKNRWRVLLTVGLLKRDGSPESTLRSLELKAQVARIIHPNISCEQLLTCEDGEIRRAIAMRVKREAKKCSE